jgi:hypothetical protein
VRAGRAHDPHVQLIREREIGDEAPLAGQERRILEPRHRSADQPGLYRRRRERVRMLNRYGEAPRVCPRSSLKPRVIMAAEMASRSRSPIENNPKRSWHPQFFAPAVKSSTSRSGLVGASRDRAM